MNKKLPVYRLVINEEDTDKLEVNYIALVDEPAIQIDWVAFSNKQRFSVDKERRLIMGAFMVADMPIFRRDKERGEYYVVFDKEEIYKIAQKFFRKGFVSNFNLMHDPKKQVEGVYLIESFLIDSSRGVKAPDVFKDLPEGSWIGTVKVDNEQVWQDFIKTGQLRGFSVEGMFEYDYQTDAPQDELEKAATEIAQCIASFFQPVTK